MFALFDLIVAFIFFGFGFWAFWPRYRFISAIEDGEGLVTIAIQRYLNLPFTGGKALVYVRKLYEPWFSVLDGNNGEKADLAMVKRLDSFLAFALATGQVRTEDVIADTSCEAASCGC